MFATTSANSGVSVVVLIAFVAIMVLVRRGRRQSQSADLDRGQRIRPLAISCIDPVISLVIIGPLLWKLLSLGGANDVAAVAGAALGVVIGYFRARVMFVRAVKKTYSVVLQRSGVEYALVFVLIVLRSVQGQLEVHHSSATTVGVSALAALGLFEAFSRAGFIVSRYQLHTEQSPTPSSSSPDSSAATNDLEVDGDADGSVS
jgi:hypothetical protein